VKPWAEKKDSSKKWHTIIPLMGIFVGLGLAALECWQGYTSVVNKSYCLVYDEDFSSGTLDSNIWTKEVGVGGFGNGQFEETTDSEENIFIRDGELWIKPTLQEANLVNFNNKLDLTGKGCTSNVWTECHAVTNTVRHDRMPSHITQNLTLLSKDKRNNHQPGQIRSHQHQEGKKYPIRQVI
jgi:hypothetical protein